MDAMEPQRLPELTDLEAALQQLVADDKALTPCPRC
jgi:hypothetical protein